MDVWVKWADFSNSLLHLLQCNLQVHKAASVTTYTYRKPTPKHCYKAYPELFRKHFVQSSPIHWDPLTSLPNTWTHCYTSSVTAATAQLVNITHARHHQQPVPQTVFNVLGFFATRDMLEDTQQCSGRLHVGFRQCCNELSNSTYIKLKMENYLITRASAP